MNKLKIYLINGFYSALIGAAVSVVTALFDNSQLIYLSNLFFCMSIGILIGTISMIFLMHIFFRLKKKPLVGFISNFIVVGVIIGIAAVYSCEIASNNISGWIYALVIAETLSFILTWVWYKEINLYNNQLEKKKASLLER